MKKADIKQDYLFFVGHPASGKTTLAGYVSRQLLREYNICVSRIDDRRFFWEVVEADNSQILYQKDKDGHVIVINPDQFYKEVFTRLSSHLVALSPADGITFVEFTSEKLMRDMNYIDHILLDASKVVVLHTTYDRALKRNERRMNNYEELNNKRIPTEYLTNCYGQNYGIANLTKHFSGSLVINNNSNLNVLREKVPTVVSFLLNRESKSHK